MSRVKTNAVHFKRNDKVIYVTDSQMAIIVGMRNDPDKRNNFVKVGTLTFSPIDVSYIEEQTREQYDLPKYFTARHEKEASSLIQIK